jgi:biopolymer transport protein ExbD
MSKARKKRTTAASGAINMTPMIDIVFQMIIFFVLTVEMERDALDERVRMAMAPHGPLVEERDPRTVTIDVNDRGELSISRVPLSPAQLRSIMRNTVGIYGQSLPVVIRGDIDTNHHHIKQAMDICTQAGLYRISFAAIKQLN